MVEYIIYYAQALKGAFIKLFFVFYLLHVLVLANAFPRAYSELAKELLKKQENSKILESIDSFHFKNELQDFKFCVDNAFVKGFQDENKREYLKSLRQCEALYEKIHYYHSREIRKSIAEDDYDNFSKLLRVGIAKSSSLEEEVLAYYQKNRKQKKVIYGESMIEDALIEKMSRRIYAEEYSEYEEYITILAKEETDKIRKMTAPSKRRNVLVSTKKTSNGYDFIAENFNNYRVTVTLQLKNTQNITVDKKLPYSFELPSKSTKKVLHVSIKNSHKRMRFQSYFSWIMGSAWAKHSDVLYRFPFAKGARIPISQGFNGKASHRGKNAIDFAVKIGTPIYAARAGRVIALQEAYNRGKFDKSYSKYANYLVIEHSDKTLAKYYHLKQGGVVPILGQDIKEGELIAYSGNTGYTSGAHLHFSVSTVDPKNMMRSKTIAIRFKNRGKMTLAPKKGDIITVQ